MTEETFGPYRIEQLLGRGGMGEVHRAYDTAHDRFVALKRLSPGYHDDEDYRARFRREARIVARLREPHVIPIHAYGEIDDRLYLDMRLVEGSDLSDLIREQTLDPVRAVRIVDQVASALDAAHADGLVHRDVKPSNILVTSSDFVYLVDFGIARSVSPSATGLTASGSVVGTLDYMAPERFESGLVDGRADIYALACVLFACLAGRRPFTADGTAAQIWAHLNEAPPKASPLNPAVPAALDDVIAKGMAKNPADRYATAGAFAQAAAQALTAPATPPAGLATPGILLGGQPGFATPGTPSAGHPGPAASGTPPVGQAGFAAPGTPPGGQPGLGNPGTPPAGQFAANTGTPPGGQPGLGNPGTPPAGQSALANPGTPPAGHPGLPRPVATGPQPPFPRPAAPGPQSGPLTPPPFQHTATGPQPVAAQPYPPTRARTGAVSPAKRAALAVGALAVVVGIVVTSLIVANKDKILGTGTTSSSTPSSTQSSTPTTTTTTPTKTRTPQDNALLDALAGDLPDRHHHVRAHRSGHRHGRHRSLRRREVRRPLRPAARGGRVPAVRRPRQAGRVLPGGGDEPGHPADGRARRVPSQVGPHPLRALLPGHLRAAGRRVHHVLPRRRQRPGLVGRHQEPHHRHAEEAGRRRHPRQARPVVEPQRPVAVLGRITWSWSANPCGDSGTSVGVVLTPPVVVRLGV